MNKEQNPNPSAPQQQTPPPGYPPYPPYMYGPPPEYKDPDEINLLEYVYALVKHKWWIIGAGVLGAIIGLVAAYIKGPTWEATATIAPKEAESQQAPSFSGLGAFGGIVASQLNMGGNASLDKIEIILNSRKFNAELIEEYNLLPLLARVSWPNVYEEYYNESDSSWDTTEYKLPRLLSAGGHLKSEYLEYQTNKNNTMNLTISSGDSLFSYTFMSRYLEYLNTYIKSNVQVQAKENIDYLEAQLLSISDPLLREKLQGLIASEFEKMMVVSKKAFRVVDDVYLQVQFKEKILFPLVGIIFLSFCIIVIVVIIHALGHAISEDDKTKTIFKNIKKEVLNK